MKSLADAKSASRSVLAQRKSILKWYAKDVPGLEYRWFGGTLYQRRTTHHSQATDDGWWIVAGAPRLPKPGHPAIGIGGAQPKSQKVYVPSLRTQRRESSYRGFDYD